MYVIVFNLFSLIINLMMGVWFSEVVNKMLKSDLVVFNLITCVIIIIILIVDYLKFGYELYKEGRITSRRLKVNSFVFHLLPFFVGFILEWRSY